MKRILLTIACTTLSLLSGTICAQTFPSQTPLSQEGVFYRCYGHLTNLRPAADHPLLLRVKRGEISAVDACMQVLAKANLVPLAQSTLTAAQRAARTPANPELSYTPRVVRDVNDREAIAVLNNFYNFHRQLFETKDLQSLPANSRWPDRHNDATEPALYLTRLLFDSGTSFSEVVTGNYSVRGIRSLGTVVRNYFGINSDARATRQLTVPGTGTERGMLWGIGAYTPGNRRWLKDDGTATSVMDLVNASVTPNVLVDTFGAQRSYGGGIMGLASYVLMNSGFPIASFGGDNPATDSSEVRSARSNASLRMHRRWAQNVLKDFLCRETPVLRARDVAPLVTRYLSPSPYSTPIPRLPFRQSSNCMGCHASIDPLAATARALFFVSGTSNWLTPAELINPETNLPYIDVRTGRPYTVNANVSPQITFVVTPSNFTNSFKSGTPRQYRISPPETPPEGEYTMMSRDPLFSQRPSSGRLRYRSYDGDAPLVDIVINAQGETDGLSILGARMAEGNDLYVCAASRYLRFFTGINVDLRDSKDPRFAPLTKEEIYYRNIAISLGMELKNHKSLTRLIRSIISSSLYQKIGMRDVG